MENTTVTLIVDRIMLTDEQASIQWIKKTDGNNTVKYYRQELMKNGREITLSFDTADELLENISYTRDLFLKVDLHFIEF